MLALFFDKPACIAGVYPSNQRRSTNDILADRHYRVAFDESPLSAAWKPLIRSSNFKGEAMTFLLIVIILVLLMNRR